MSALGVLAIDLGTSVVKAAVVADGGRLVAIAERPLTLRHGDRPGEVEQDAEEWWDRSLDAVRDVLARATGVEVVALCAGGQGPSVVAVDEHGIPVGPALTWMDTRADTVRIELSERLGAAVSPYASVPRAAWLSRHTVGARWLLQSWDYLVLRLTGTAVTSSFAGDAVFPDALLAAAGVERRLVGQPLLMGTTVGPVLAEVAREVGLPQDVVVCGGVNDFTAGVIGAGLDRKGLALDLGGTSGGIALAHDAPLERGGLTAWPAPTPGLFICGGPLASGGRSLSWIADVAGFGTDLAALEREAAAAPAGSDGIVFLPYLSGERAPLWDARARGVFFGLSERHTRGHLARAVLEGVAFAMRHIADTLASEGARVDELRVGGGQSRLLLAARIKADVLGVPVVIPRVTELSLLGEAMLAANAVPAARDAVGIRGAADVARRFEPAPAHQEVYARAYTTYRELYPRLRDLW